MSKKSKAAAAEAAKQLQRNCPQCEEPLVAGEPKCLECGLLVPGVQEEPEQSEEEEETVPEKTKIVLDYPDSIEAVACMITAIDKYTDELRTLRHRAGKKGQVGLILQAMGEKMEVVVAHLEYLELLK